MWPRLKRAVWVFFIVDCGLTAPSTVYSQAPPRPQSCPCNSSAWPWPMCGPACSEAGLLGPALAAPTPLHHARDCSNCTDTVCTMSVAADIGFPPPTTTEGEPRAGARVVATAAGWDHTKVYHTLMLPTATSRPSTGWPLYVEFPGNYCGPGGPEGPDCGSEWTMQGWGLGAYRGDVLWLTLPFLTADLGNDTAVQFAWWGCQSSGDMDTDPNCTNATYTPVPTVNYTLDAVRQTLARYDGDPNHVVLLGHSRGAIATQAIGGYNDEIASLWTQIVAASHFDMPPVESWPYNNQQLFGGIAGAVARGQRIAHVPKFLTGECSLALQALGWHTANNLSTIEVVAKRTGFRDHTGFWVGRPSPTGARDEARQWISNLFK